MGTNLSFLFLFQRRAINGCLKSPHASRNPKHEIRNSKQIQITEARNLKLEGEEVGKFGHLDSGFLPAGRQVFRISIFEFRIHQITSNILPTPAKSKNCSKLSLKFFPLESLDFF